MMSIYNDFLLTSSQSNNLCIVLVRTRNPLNIGAAARAMSNFDFLKLRVVEPFDVAFREARSAVGAPELLVNAEEFGSVAEAVADCSLVVGTTAVGSRVLAHPLKRLEEGGAEIRSHLGSGRVALLFGSEKRGLSNDDLSHCHWLMRIPTRDEHISMNLGQAVAVCLYELMRSSELVVVSGELTAPASADELERLTLALFEALTASGYVKARSEAITLEKVRRLVRRMSLNSEDADTWTGMLGKMKSGSRE